MGRLVAWVILVAFALYGAVALVPQTVGSTHTWMLLPYPILVSPQYVLLLALASLLAVAVVVWAAFTLGGSRPLGATPEALGVTGIAAGAVLAAMLGRVPPLQAGIGAALGIIAFRAGLSAHRALDDGETIGLRTQWGGLGGGLGGWHMSRPAALVIILLVAGLAAGDILRPAPAVAPLPTKDAPEELHEGPHEGPHK